MNPSKWLAHHTFHHSDFLDLKKLVETKEKKGLKISLCIPTLNEGETIGKEVVLFRSELYQRNRLLDEIVVIDSGSTDRTREIASSFGADVYLASEILPDLEERAGKGENLWKAIYQLSGDIIVYVDADIKNIHPRFVYGLVGPLVLDDSFDYVKAFYDRPLAFSDGARPTGGGRVTEILVRPLFSLFFPELAAIIQPLSGEYAVRRRVLERIPFPIGYGVETAHLIDVHSQFGIDAFAQTDLDQRIHESQGMLNLGRMSFGILETFFRRLKQHSLVGSLSEMTNVMRQFQVAEGVYELVEHSMSELERPPMIEVEAYREKRQIEWQMKSTQ